MGYIKLSMIIYCCTINVMFIICLIPFSQLKLFAIRPLSTFAVINDGYSPKAASVSTITRYYSGQSVMFGDVSSGYAFGFQIVFPLILVFCSSIFFL